HPDGVGGARRAGVAEARWPEAGDTGRLRIRRKVAVRDAEDVVLIYAGVLGELVRDVLVVAEAHFVELVAADRFRVAEDAVVVLGFGVVRAHEDVAGRRFVVAAP